MSGQESAHTGLLLAEQRAHLPGSCTNMAINFTGFAGFVAAIYVFTLFPDVDPVLRTTACIAALTVPIAALELIFLKTHRRTSTGLDFTLPQSLNLARVGIKLAGFYGTFIVMIGLYWLLPVYQEGFYQPFFRIFFAALPIVVIGAVPYFFIIDRYMSEPEDRYYQAGLAFIGRWSELDKPSIRQHALGWVVKGFFLPLMFVFLNGSITFVVNYDMEILRGSFIGFYEFAYNGLFAVDLVIACAGYVMTVRLLDSHIRTTEPTLGGWVPTIICYQPFWMFFYGAYLTYDDGNFWGGLLGNDPVLQVFWGCLILALTIIYVSASVVFGIRFSNLTHRGILTNGPFRWSKHPAYISKNLSWWMVSVPFISTAGFDIGIKLSLLLLGVNFIYFLRARTEERHLSRDPVYVTYAMAMNERALLRPLGRLIPYFQYKPPAQPVSL